MDRAWWRANTQEIKSFKGELFSGVSMVAGTKHAKIDSPKNSGAGAISLAAKFGALRIILLGYDCQHTGGKAHWHGDHKRPLGNAANVARWPEQFAEVAKAIGHIEVINASRSTALTVWPTAEIEDVLQ